MARLHTSAQIPRIRWGIALASGLFFALMLVFALGNAATVYVLVSRFDSSLTKLDSVDRIRVLSQQIAIQAMRLTDGAYIQTAQLSRNLDTFERTVQALKSGGIVDDHEIEPIKDPPLQVRLAEVALHWESYRARVRSVLLNSYSRESVKSLDSTSRQALLRQWVADDAATLHRSIERLGNAMIPVVKFRSGRVLRYVSIALLLNIAVLILAFILVRQHLILPLRRLRGACVDLMEGNYSTHIEYWGPGELGEVASAFNIGAQRIHTLLDSERLNRIRLERSDTVFRGLAANSLVGIYLAQDDRFSFVSPKMSEIFGYTVQEMIDTVPVLGVIVPKERYLVAESLKASLQRKDGTIRYERHGRKKDGSVIDIEVFSSSITVDGQVSIIGIVQDITERKKAEASAQLAEIAYENSSEAIAVTDAAGVVIDVNPAFSRMTGYWSDEVKGEVLALLKPGRHNREFFDTMWHQINTTGRWAGDYWSRHKSGEKYAERVIVDTAWNHDGSVNCRVAMLSDITEKKQTEALIWRQAHHDPLTGLPNRQYFTLRLEQALEQADRESAPLALLFLDLDMFKEINDSMGHGIGDQLLIEVARRLNACTENIGFVARLGGDEFIIIVEHIVDRGLVEDLCSQILASLTEPYRLAGEALRVSVSVGVALYPNDAEDQETLMRHVDLAMYAAKDAGRNRCFYFDQDMRERARIQHNLVRGLSEALAQGQFFLEYQPIYSMHARVITRAEALLRWRHPEFGVVQPMDFIPFAEDRQLISSLGDWVFQHAASQLAQWRDQYETALQMTVNISPSQLVGSGVNLTEWLRQLDRLGLPGDSIVLELAEHMLMGMDTVMIGRLEQLRAAGMRIGLDDFGVGSSSLSIMSTLPVDYIKLDRVFTEHLAVDSSSLMVCEAIILLAHQLGFQVIAAGVTTAEQHELLQRAGCDAGQGYWYGTPLAPEDLERRLQAGEGLPLDC
ncbi:EAL domain-containing protein [Alcaligenaceae bacterium CGII-47]|nr:EAL domain-containing protein [Alcaligenaceae bacterium CGII-47]